MRFLAALWMLCLFADGCEHRDMSHSKAPEAAANSKAPEQVASKTSEPVDKTNANPIFELIDRLDKAPTLTPEDVTKTMHVELSHNPENSGPTFKAYTQPASAASPYKSVELHMPNDTDEKDRLLSVQLSNDGGVTRKEIIARYGLEFDTHLPSPESQGQPIYLHYKRPDGYVSFGVTNDDSVRLVSFVVCKGKK
jgi:hypothetical protein